MLPLNILVIESDLASAARLQWELLEHGVTRAATVGDACQLIKHDVWFDVVLCPTQLPTKERTQLHEAVQPLPDPPLVVATDTRDPSRILHMISAARAAKSVAVTMPIPALERRVG